MFQAVWTEVRGWREALTDRGTVLAYLRLALCATLCSAGGAVGSGIVGAPAAVLGTFLIVSGMFLIWLRVAGRP